MTERLVDPAVARQFWPAFGLLPDILDRLDVGHDHRDAYRLDVQPPPVLASIHEPRMLARFWQRLLAVVRRPTRTIEVGGTKYVQVAGSSLIQIRPNGTLQAYAWQGEQLGDAGLQPLDEWTVVLQGMPHRDLWLRHLAPLAALEVKRLTEDRGLDVSLAQAHQYSQWAFGVFWKQLRRHADLRQMRRAVATALGHDTRLIPLAGRLPRTSLPAGVVLMGAYNRVLRHRAAFETLLREAPQLIPVFGALCDEPSFPQEGEATARLKRYLKNDTMLGPSHWRQLVRASSRLFQPLAEFYAGDAACAAAQHLNLWALLGHPPNWLMRELLAGRGDRNHRWPSYVSDFMAAAPLWQVVVDHLRDQAPTPQRLDELDRVARWIGRPDAQTHLHKNQLRLGWPYLVRQADRWLQDVERQLRDSQDVFDAPFDEARINGLSLRALRSGWALWEEGRQMRHCAGRLIDDCRAGRLLLLAAAEGEGRLATVSYKRQGEHWVRDQVQGFANARVDDRIVRLLPETMPVVVPWPLDDDAVLTGFDVDAGIYFDAESDMGIEEAQALGLPWRGSMDSRPVDFEVGESGTLTLAGVPEPQTRGDVFSISTSARNMQGLIRAIQDCVPLVAHFEELALQALEDARSDLDQDDIGTARRRELSRLIDAMENAGEGNTWEAWLSHQRQDLARFKEEVEAWLASPVNWNEAEWFESSWSGQSMALDYFRGMDRALRDALGVVVVEGDCPGSSYFAAEFHGDLDAANACCRARELAIRFRQAD